MKTQTIKILLISFFVLLFAIFVAGYLCAECLEEEECSYNGECFEFGAITNIAGSQYYCDINGVFVIQKFDNSGCVNNEECLSGSCIGGLCVNRSQLLKDFSALMNFSADKLCFEINPGCLNMSSISNGINTSAICPENEKCFKCNEYYSWNSSSLSCNLRSCESVSGQKCLNFSNASSLSHGSIAIGACNNNYNCFKCNSGYNWNASICSEIVYDSYGNYDTGYWIYTGTVNSNQFAKGYTFTFKERYRLKVSILGENHYIGVVKINFNTKKVTINVSSTSQQAILREGENKRFEVTGDNYYDIMVRLNGIDTISRANITIKTIREMITSQAVNTSITQTGSSGGVVETESEESSSLKTIILIVIMVLIVIVIGAIVYNLVKNRRYKLRGY